MDYLSRDIINLIFIKLGAIEILRSAQYVCSLWWNLSKQASLYRSLDFRRQWNLADFDMSNEEKLEKQKLVRLSALRSCGQIAEFSIDGFLDKELLQFIIYHISTDSLICLRIVYFHEHFEKELIDIIRNAPMLEELDLSYLYSVSRTVFEEIGRSCPHLKSFRFDNHYGARYYWCGNHAEGIAQNMPNLRRLHLFGSLPVFGEVPVKDELQWILHGCPNLEYLDLRYCTRVDADQVLETGCVERIASVRLPGDSIDDYDYHSYLERYMDCDCGSWHPLTASDVLLMRFCNDDYNYYDDDDDDDDDLENFICLLPSKAATCYI